MRPNRTPPAWVTEDADRQKRLAWKPTPQAFEAFKARDLELARHNLCVLSREWDVEPDGVLHNFLTFGKAKADLEKGQW